MYNSLLLNAGGGIIPRNQKSEQSKEAAVLAIGLGGTGVRALSRLKQSVYHQLRADNEDNPGEPIKNYKHIQFLAIDSDDSDIRKIKGYPRLDSQNEFFSLHDENLKASLQDKNAIKDNPRLRWMDIDRINELLSPDGAGGIRQIGRYLLIKKSQEFRSMISGKITQAMENMGNAKIHVYIFAGISGGTGSGCFLDTCYMVRRILEEGGRGGSSRIMGFFFLPDVVTSKKEVASNPQIKQWNESNGYAAMKELDYLMNLKSAGKKFRQVYGDTFFVDTDEPPVDMCHLVSAKKANGEELANGFEYSINVVADYVLSYLAFVEGADPTKTDNGLTMTGHLANVQAGVGGLEKNAGASLNYHVVGASNAEIPMTQIATYLAAGFIRRFQEQAGVKTVSITQEAIKEFAKNMGLTVDKLVAGLQHSREYPEIYLPDVDFDMIKNIGPCPPGIYPRMWADAANNTFSKLEGAITNYRNSLTAVPEELNITRLTESGGTSLVTKLFTELCRICMREEHGPYYAAALLSQPGYNLMNYLDGQIDAAQSAVHAAQGNMELAQKYSQEAQARIFDKGFLESKKKLANNYKDSVDQWFREDISQMELTGALNILKSLKVKFMNYLKNDFFDKLIAMLDELKSTFEADETYLSGPEASLTDAYTTRLVNLSDVKTSLDASIQKLQPNELITEFLNDILNHPQDWLNNDDVNVGIFISNYMQRKFNAEVNKSIEKYLQEKFPGSSSPSALEALVREKYIDALNKSAQPMFWSRPSFHVGTSTFSVGSMSVPSAASTICIAADNYVKGMGVAANQYMVRKTGISDRIFALRFHSGLPFYAYQGISTMVSNYNASESSPFGIGAHLYAKTGRGDGIDDSGLHDWRRELPVPMPYSIDPSFTSQGEALERLYTQAEEAGIIVPEQVAVGNASRTMFHICTSREIPQQSFTDSDFLLETGAFDQQKWSQYKTQLETALSERENHPENKVIFAFGANSSDVPTQRRIHLDYFIHYDRYQDMVQKELDTRNYLKEALQKLEDIRSRLDSYIREIDRYNDLILFGFLECLNGQGKEDLGRYVLKTIRYTYQDKFGTAKEEIFAARDDESELQREPLYRGFLHFREMDPEMEPRRTLERLLTERKKQNLVAGRDNVIAYRFQQAWDADLLKDMERELQGVMTPEKQEEVRRYYHLLILKIQELERQFGSDWSTGALEAAAPGEALPSKPEKEKVVIPLMKPSAPSSPAGGESDSWVCPDCGKENDEKRKFCGGCGHPKPQKKEENWICPYCQAQNSLEDLFCGECGKEKPPAGSWVCASCQSLNGEGENFCGECGKPKG